MNSKRVFCIIVTFNAENWIQKCLDSVLSSSVPCSIIVVDNHSRDNTCQIIKSGYPSIRLIEKKENLGFGKGNNIGIKLAYNEGADFFFLLNQDAWVQTNTIEKLVNIQEQYPEMGIVSPLHFYDNLSLDYKFEKYIKSKRELILNNRKDSCVTPINFVNAAVWMINRNCIDKVGIFAPIFSHYAEDLNYAHRCKYHQVGIGIYADAIAYHERPQNPPKEKGVPIKKLYVREKAYWLGVLSNLKYSFLRQTGFLIFTSIRELIVSLLLLRGKTILVIFSRLGAIPLFFELLSHRKIMRKKSAYLNPR